MQSRFKRVLPISPRGQSEIISTVLLILLVIAAVFILMSVVIPFVRNNLSESNCFKVSGATNSVEIVENNRYTCYDKNNNKMRVQIHYGDTDELGGFVLELSSAGSSRTLRAQMGVPVIGLTLYPSGIFVFPNKNEERTYEISAVTPKPETITVYPLLKGGKLCAPLQEITDIPDC